MCGIVGYVGPRDASPILLDGLRRLEYRGYDSAGIAILTPAGKIDVRKSEGKLKKLVDALGIDHSTVTKMLQRLERSGVVARQQSADDRRVVLVHLTEEGCVQRRAVEEMWARIEAATSGGLSEEEHAQLLGLLRRVEAHLDQLDQR